MSERTRTVEELEQRIADLEARMPKHSIPPSMLIELDELEEALRQARSKVEEEQQP